MKELEKLMHAADIHHALSLDDTLTEDEQDIEYDLFWEQINRIAQILVEITAGQIDEFTAKRMAVHKRDKLIAILKLA